MKDLPAQVELPGMRPIPILRKRLHPSKLGYWDPKRKRIVVSSRISGPAAHTILLHEILHVCECAMLDAGVIRARPPHDFITSLAPNLLLVLMGAGLWRGGLSLDKFARFYAELQEGPNWREKPFRAAEEQRKGGRR